MPAVVGIGLDIFGQAQEAQAAEHHAADGGAVLADAAGEDQRVEPLQSDHEPRNRLGQPVDENLDGELRPLISRGSRGLDRAHVAADAR